MPAWLIQQEGGQTSHDRAHDFARGSAAMITFACPHCKKILSVKDQFAGRNGKCPHCKQPSQVPGPVKRSDPAKPVVGPGPAPGTVTPETIAATADNQPIGLETRSAQPEDEVPFEFDFLAPPQAADEMGRLGS